MCAAEPILVAITWTAFFKPVLPSDPFAALIRWSMVLVILVTLPAPGVLQWLVLRRTAPRLRLWTWLGAVLLAELVHVAALAKVAPLARPYDEFARAVGNRTEPLFALPWGSLLASTATVTAAAVLVPAWVFARTAGLRWYAPLLAAIAAACIAGVAHQTYYLLGLHVHASNWVEVGHAMNGWSWRDRLAEICLLGGTGAIWGANSALFLALLVRRAEPASIHPTLVPRGAGRMLAAIFAISVITAMCAVVFNPRTARATYNFLAKQVSPAPANDVSVGDEILRYSHTAQVQPDRYPAPSFSPNGESFLVVAADRRLVRVETATGRTLGAIGEPLPRNPDLAVAWSIDGRFLATRTAGEQVFMNSRFIGTRARFRIYTLSDNRIAGDYTHREGACFSNSYAQPSMLFEPDGTSFWVVCGQRSHPQANDIAVLKLEVPSMRVLKTHYYADYASSGEVQGLARVGDGVWSWQHNSGATEDLLVRDLTHDRVQVHLRDPSELRFADGFVPYLRGRVTEGRIELLYRGETSDGRAVTLSFDLGSGEFVEKRDEPRSLWELHRDALDLSDDLRVEATWAEDSKAGEIDVMDRVSSMRRQHIVTHGHWLGELSPDGRWLVMNAIHVPALRIYRVTLAQRSAPATVP